MAPGTLVRVYNDVHALGLNETLTKLCVRILPARAHEESLRTTVARVEAARDMAYERAEIAERELANAQGSWFRQHYGIGWLSTFAFFGIWITWALLHTLAMRKRRNQRFARPGRTRLG